jgi:hypothetical protein
LVNQRAGLVAAGVPVAAVGGGVALGVGIGTVIVLVVGVAPVAQVTLVKVTSGLVNVTVTELLSPGMVKSYPAISVAPGASCRLPSIACGPMLTMLLGQLKPVVALHDPELNLPFGSSPL